MKFLTRFGASAGTALAVLVVLAACTGGADVAPGSPSPSAAGSSASAAPATAAKVANQSFEVSDGAVFSKGLAGKATTLAFGAGGTSFSLASGGNQASGDSTFGSCDFAFRTSTFPQGSGPQVGDTIKIDPCVIEGDGALSFTFGGTTTKSTRGAALASPTPTVTPTPGSTATPTPSPTATATAAPTEAATETPRATRTPDSTDAPKATEPAKTPEPTPTPTPTPTPAPTAAAGYPGGIAGGCSGMSIMTCYRGKVTDSVTGAGIAGVCVYAGPPAGCPAPNLNTDAQGSWSMDFPTGTTWQFNFQHPAYNSQLQKTGTTINIAMVKK